MAKAVHFGGGNIGRGFVGEFLHTAGYEVVFVDVMDAVIKELQDTTSYVITEISEEGETKKTITNYRAINSKEYEADVVEEISTADIVTCAVGPNILKFIAPVIAKGLVNRKKSPRLTVIACENAIGATDTLRGHIQASIQKMIEERTLSGDALSKALSNAVFANCAIDRIVPNQDANHGLNVRIEKYFEWVVEQAPFKEAKQEHPNIPAIHWVDNLTPYIERKLFTVNTGHATTAYYGHLKGKKTIHDALADPKIKETVHKVLDETASLIIVKHGISEKEQREYVEKIIERFSNHYLEDNVERVGRAPLRKLSRNERFIGPASELAERGMKFDALVNAFEKALLFQNVKGDDESEALARLLKDLSPEEATTELTGLKEDHPLYASILEKVALVKKATK